jgi:hypothetical protein
MMSTELYKKKGEKTMSSSNKDRTIELLEELVKWTRVTSIPHVKQLLEEILTSPEEKVAYESSDGRPSQEIAVLANISFHTVTVWWKKWIKVGLAEPISSRGGQRAKRLFSLTDFGIDVPQLPHKEITKSDRETGQSQLEEKKREENE